MLHHYPNHGCGGAAEHGCGGATAASFSALFHVPRKLPAHEAYDAHHDAAVDCTLSLGTPSTRRGGSPAPAPAPASASAPAQPRRAPCAAASTLWWGVVSKRKERSQEAAAVGFKESGASAGASVNLGADPLVARRCANCDTTSTPLWRNGPRGPKVCTYHLFEEHIHINTHINMWNYICFCIICSPKFHLDCRHDHLKMPPQSFKSFGFFAPSFIYIIKLVLTVV